MTDQIAKRSSWCRDFVFKQKCIPWKLRLIARRLLPWKFRRLVTRGSWNTNRPETMDSRYENLGDDYRSMQNLYDNIIPMLPVAGKCIDVGCGIAVLLRLIRQAKSGLELHGVDFSQIAIERTLEYGFEAKKCFLPDIPYPDNFFDTVICTEVLEHLDWPGQSVEEFYRILKPGGLLIVSVPKDMGPDHCDEHVQDFTGETLAACLSDNKFCVGNIRTIVQEPDKNNGESFLAVAKSTKKHSAFCQDQTSQLTRS